MGRFLLVWERLRVSVHVWGASPVQQFKLRSLPATVAFSTVAPQSLQNQMSMAALSNGGELRGLITCSVRG